MLAAVTLTMSLASASVRAAYEEIAVKDGGAVSGVVRFSGPSPKLEPIAVARQRDVCGDRKPPEALVLGPDRGVKGAVVLLEGITRGKKASTDVFLDTRDCTFVDHVTAIGPGDRLRVKNSDPVVHNTHGRLGKPTSFNLALPGKGQEIDITKRLAQPGAVRIQCEAHAHMTAWVVVHDSPYYAVTDERGAFRIDGVPPGTYKLTMWHEGFRARGIDRDGRPAYVDPVTITKQVTVAPRGAATMHFELK